MKLLIINSGSSSVKYNLFEMENEQVVMTGKIDRIGLDDSFHSFEIEGSGSQRLDVTITDHGSALDELFRVLVEFGPANSLEEIKIIGHRVAHGGKFKDPVVITPEVISEIKRMTPFFPLHHPAMAVEIEECIVRLPDALHVAVFDMSFHKTIPDVAAIYGLPYKYFAEQGYRRTGYHGHSHEYVSIEAARYFNSDLSDLKLISCHLGNGCSITAIDRGRSVDTTLGMSAVSGLIMGTRSGDVDPGLLVVIMDQESMSPDDLNNLLFKESGLLGISGISRDMREITQCADLGETRAQLAIDAFCYQVKRSIGSMLMILGGCDALIFTGGIGENSELVRKKALSNCENLGFSIDDKLNENCFEDANAKVADISAKGCRVKTLVIRTFEELMMARQCLEVATREGIMFK
mgnify:FL=1